VYRGDFHFYKRLQRNYGNLRAEAARMIVPENWKFISKCFEETAYVNWDVTTSTLWECWIEKRFDLIQANNCEERLCWLAMMARVVRKKGNRKIQIKATKAGLIERNIDEENLLENLKHFMKWDRTESNMSSLWSEYHMEFCDLVRDVMFPDISYVLRGQEVSPEFDQELVSRVLSRKAMNIGDDDVLSSITEEDIENDIELLETLDAEWVGSHSSCHEKEAATS
jgi:hypothetical protein